jgi:hypothetical protein
MRRALRPIPGKTAVTSLTALALLLLSLFAPGTMPARAAGGGFTVELCATDGGGTITLDAQGDPVPSGPGADRACPWAISIAAALPTLAPAPAPSHAVQPAAAPTAPALPDLLRLAKHTHAQGPPPVFPA